MLRYADWRGAVCPVLVLLCCGIRRSCAEMFFDDEGKCAGHRAAGAGLVEVSRSSLRRAPKISWRRGKHLQVAGGKGRDDLSVNMGLRFIRRYRRYRPKYKASVPITHIRATNVYSTLHVIYSYQLTSLLCSISPVGYYTVFDIVHSFSTACRS